MKIDLSIYHRILFEDLRPWIDGNKSETKFQNKITPTFKNPKGVSNAFDKAITAALKDWKQTNVSEDYIIEIEEDNEQFKSIADEISEPLIEVATDEPTNSKQQFYFFLIRNEATRLINNLHKAVQISTTKEEKKSLVVNTFYKLNSILNDVEKQKKQLQKIQQTAQKKDNDFIFSVLKNTLIRLHLEMKEVFPDLLGGKALTEKGIFENILKESQPENSVVKNKIGLNSFAVKRYIKSENYSKTKTISLINETLEKIIQHFSDSTATAEEADRKRNLQENIQALENLYYSNENSLVDVRPTYENLLDNNFETELFNKAIEPINERVEEPKTGAKRLPVIAKEEKALEFLKYTVEVNENVFLSSVPRQIKVVLAFAKLNAEKNLAVDFSKIVEATNQRIKTNLSVPQLAFLFKALAELNPKIFDTNSEAELLRFISAAFITKKSSDEGISTEKLRQLFNQPNDKAAEFWYEKFSALMATAKKFK